MGPAQVCPCAPMLVTVLLLLPPPQPGAAPPELLTADVRLSRGLLPPSPGTHKEGEGSFPSPFPQLTQTSGSFPDLIVLFFFLFSLPHAGLTINQVALPKDHPMQLIPHMKTTSQSSFPPFSFQHSFNLGCRDSGGGRGCSAPIPILSVNSRLLPGVLNPSAHVHSPAPFFFSIPVSFPREGGD